MLAMSYAVIVPEGAVPGQTLMVQSPSGQNEMICIPPGVQPGQEITVLMHPAAMPQQQLVTSSAPMECPDYACTSSSIGPMGAIANTSSQPMLTMPITTPAGTRLAGKTIGIFLDFQYEDLEVHYPKIRLEEEGAQVLLIGTHPAGMKYTGKHGYPARSDRSVDDVNAQQLDALVLPGGFAPDYMRRNVKMLQIISTMVMMARPVAAICHGPWMLCSARNSTGSPVIQGVRVTSFSAIKDDIINAGGMWEDSAVVEDRNIITSRTPADLALFCKEIIAALCRSFYSKPDLKAEVATELKGDSRRVQLAQ